MMTVPREDCGDLLVDVGVDATLLIHKCKEPEEKFAKGSLGELSGLDATAVAKSSNFVVPDASSEADGEMMLPDASSEADGENDEYPPSAGMTGECPSLLSDYGDDEMLSCCSESLAESGMFMREL